MNKKGFISMTLVYTFLILFLFLVLSILATYTQKNKFLDGVADKVKNKVIIDNNYYPFGTSNTVWTYGCTNNAANFKVPSSGYYKIQLWGASGGISTPNSTNNSKGAYTEGEIFLDNDDTLYINVGCAGTTATKAHTIQESNLSGGYNGGGDAGYYSSNGGGGGGGATDIRINDTAIQARIMVAGGGGGNANWTNGKTGGHATGLYSDNLGNSNETNVCAAESLYDGKCYSNGAFTTTYFKNAISGNQIVGGTKGSSQKYIAHPSYIAYDGTLGNGGNASIVYGGGGGGGYYGGGGGSIGDSVVGSGAGGSSYISGHIGCVAIDVYSVPICSNGNSLNCSIHYTKKAFSKTIMIDGAGYKWTSSKGSKITLPTNPGGNNGYARITFLRSE